ncbi:MAG: PrgI family protein [Patescibacteria group bacterium]
MPRNQFVVPQFLDVEAKIIGPITARQFLIMLGTLLLDFVIYRVFLNVFIVIALGVPVLALGIAFSFAKVNGQPFHYMVLSVIQTLRRPARRVWDKSLSDADLRVYLKKEVVAMSAPKTIKKPLERSRLSELSMVVNTGGVYEGDDNQL